MGHIRAGLIFSGFLIVFAIYMPSQALVRVLRPSRDRVAGLLFMKAFAALAGIKVRQEGEALGKTGVGCLVVSNHVSYFDAAAIGALLPMSFVAKSQIASWPLIGWMAKLGGTIFVNRESRAAAAKDMQAIQNRLDRGETIVLFPEGTSSDGMRVLPFKSALLGAVERTNDKPDVWIQPVSLAYRTNWGLPMSRRNRPFFAWYGDMDFLPHKWGAYVQGPFEIVVRFHPPVRRGDFASRKELAAWCQSVIRRGMEHDLRAEEGAPELPGLPGIETDQTAAAIAAE